MPITPLERTVKRYRAAIRDARGTGRDPDDLFAEREAASAASPVDIEVGRRRFLRGAAVGAATLAGSSVFASAENAWATTPRVAVVGAGFAGLTAAHEIHRRRPGWRVQVFEGQERVGGRARTIRSLTGGQYTEAGPSGISSNEDVIQRVCRRLDLWPLVDTWLGYPAGPEQYWFDGQRRTWNQIKGGVKDVADAAWNSWTAMGAVIPTWDDHTATAAGFDAMTVAGFIQDEAGVSLTSPAGRYLVSNFGSEYGGPADQASAIHQILEESGIWGGGGFDERWAVPGGNDRLARSLQRTLPRGSVHLGHRLMALTQRADGVVRLTFDVDGGGTRDVLADQVVLALPPTTLRDADLSRAGFSSTTLEWINQQGMGTNSKVNLQFEGQPWKDSGRSGDAITDLLPQVTWQASYQGTATATLVCFTNRFLATPRAHGTAPGHVRSEVLGDLELLYPGISGSLIKGQVYLDFWRKDPWVKGSYSFMHPGGFTGFNGIQDRAQGAVHFAGEATATYIHRGTMNGAVESGLRAARAIC